MKYLILVGLIALPFVATAGWWCGLESGKIVECMMIDGIVQPIKKEILYNNFFPEPEVQVTMRKIAKCESGENQTINGKIVKGPDGFDLGFFQLRSLVWEKEAEKLGLDIHTIEGNFGMARILYDRFGFAPWVCYRK